MAKLVTQKKDNKMTIENALALAVGYIKEAFPNGFVGIKPVVVPLLAPLESGDDLVAKLGLNLSDTRLFVGSFVGIDNLDTNSNLSYFATMFGQAYKYNDFTAVVFGNNIGIENKDALLNSKGLFQGYMVTVN